MAFCEIILSRRFPKHLGIFDYQIPKNLRSEIKIGSLVKIPFRASEREGVVIKIKHHSPFGQKIKDVTGLADGQSILTEEQIKLAEWMAGYYFISLGTVIKTMLPPVPKRKVTNRPDNPATSREVIVPAKQIKNLAKKILISQVVENLFWPADLNEQKQFLAALLNLKPSGQTLIIVPEISDLDNILSILPLAIIKNTSLISSQLNKTKFFDAWKKIQSGQARLIIGTKLSLFLPFQNLRTIIIVQEQDGNHKQSEQNPRFDARLAAKKLAGLFPARLVYISPAPTLRLMDDIYRQQAELLKTASPPDKKISLVDMRQEREKRNFSPYSEKLTLACQKTLDSKKKVFLFINRRGSASSVICRDCGHVFTCPKCGLPLTFHSEQRSLYCHRCYEKSLLPRDCPDCHGVNFKFLGSGTQRLEEEAKKFWPRARIARVDLDTKNPASAQKAQIIIGTEYALKKITWQNIGLAGIVTADSALYLPDYRSTERTYQLLSTITFLCPAPVIVQTYSPDNIALRAFSQQKPDLFYQAALKERSDLRYPPSFGLVKLIFQHREKAACLKEAQRLFKILRTSPLEIGMILPQQPYRRRLWFMYLTIKHRRPEQNQILDKILKSLPNSWLIDRDPETLL